MWPVIFITKKPARRKEETDFGREFPIQEPSAPTRRKLGKTIRAVKNKKLDVEAGQRTGALRSDALHF
jgi:hypothetical protein